MMINGVFIKYFLCLRITDKETTKVANIVLEHKFWTIPGITENDKSVCGRRSRKFRLRSDANMLWVQQQLTLNDRSLPTPFEVMFGRSYKSI